jgi:beta-barrel assembly-enhancing protease
MSEPDPRILPPPPPPPAASFQRSAGAGQGFQPLGRPAIREMLVVAGLLIALIAGAAALAGRIASAAVDWVPLEVDKTLGSLAWESSGWSASECTNPEAQAYVEKVAAPLLARADAPFEIRFRVVADESVNAFALPGGYVTVNHGLLIKAKTGDEVAGVIAHELEHAILRHSTRRMLREMSGNVLLAVLLGYGDVGQIGQLANSFSSGAYDRAQESEADLKGAELLVKAGISVRGLKHFFERLAAESPDVPEFLSSHPRSEDRARSLERFANSATIELPPPGKIACE